MADKTVVVKVDAKVDGAVSGLRKVKASVDDLTKADIKKPSAAFADISNKAALMGGAVALGIGKAISSFAEFDAQMSAVSAALPEAGAQMGQLRDLATQLGKDTQFSATEAAQGITEMAKAGVDAADILNGGLKGGLDLAAAGQLDVAQASEIAATALNQFGLRGKDVSHVADLYAAAAGKAQGSVQDIALAMKYAGVTASSMGVSIEEATGVLGLFASKGIIGEQAGTSFRSMLLSLTSPSKIAAKTMQDLGINVYDAGGKFIGMQGAADELQRKLGPLSEATRNQALGQIFGNESMNAAVALYEGGGQAVSDWTDKVNQAGFAQKQAAKLTDNLKGDVERLSGSLETVFIQAGSGANDALRTLTQGLGGLVDIIGKIPGPILLAGSALGSFALLAPKGISMWRNYVAQLDTLGLSLDKISAKAPRAGAALSFLGKAGTVAAISGVAVGIKEWANAALVADPATDRLAKGLDQLAKGAKESTDFGSLFAGGLGPFRDDMEQTGRALDSFAKNARAALAPEWYETALGAASDATGAFEERTKQLDAALTQMVQSGNTEGAAAAFKQLTDAAVAQGAPIDKLKAAFPEYAAALAAAAAQGPVSKPDVDTFTGAIDEQKKSAEDAKTALDNLKSAIEGFGSPEAAARAAERDYQAAVDEAAGSIKDYRDELIKKYKDQGKGEATAKKLADADIAAGKALDVNTEAGRKNQAALDALREKTLAKVTTTFDLTQSEEQAAKAMQTGRDEFIKSAVQMGLNGDKAKALADKMGLIPEDVRSQITISGVPTAEKQIKDVKSLYDQLKDKTVTITVAYRAAAIAAGTQANRVHSDLADIRGTMATGGPVRGPGTGTSDTAGLFALSNGEHVLTAAEVAAAGGHAAIFALRKAILAGGVQFRAAGGPAVPMSAYRAAPPPPFDPTGLISALSSVRQGGGDTFHAYGLDVDDAINRAVRNRDWRLRN